MACNSEASSFSLGRKVCEEKIALCLRVGVVVKDIAIGAGGLGSIPGPVKSAQHCEQFATAASLLRSCVVQVTRFVVIPRA